MYPLGQMSLSRASFRSATSLPIYSATASANLHSTANLGMFSPSYVFATPIFGGQGALSLLALVGNSNTTLAGTVSGTLNGIPFGPRFDSISNSTTGFGDLYPQYAIRWNSGVNNYMTYITGDIPVGDYSSTNLSNIGIGHGAVDAGGGYTYFNPETGHDLSGRARLYLQSDKSLDAISERN